MVEKDIRTLSDVLTMLPTRWDITVMDGRTHTLIDTDGMAKSWMGIGTYRNEEVKVETYDHKFKRAYITLWKEEEDEDE